jgi:hypothetical protein
LIEPDGVEIDRIREVTPRPNGVQLVD